jgi:hypothetical protein
MSFFNNNNEKCYGINHCFKKCPLDTGHEDIHMSYLAQSKNIDVLATFPADIHGHVVPDTTFACPI